MILLQQVKMPVKHSRQELEQSVCKALHISSKELKKIVVRKRSVDARKKDAIFFSYVVSAEVVNEDAVLRKLPKGRFTKEQRRVYQWEITGTRPMLHRPVIIGTGPAGLFCGYQLALAGYRPILLERGKAVEERVKDVERFFDGGPLNPESNVQFGEGGAGTFSDGKLNTLVKDKDGKGAYIMELFARMGAPEEICYINKPHIGTDRLRQVVRNLREEIIALGGEIHFESKMTDILTENGRLTGIVINEQETIPCEVLVLAIGHSARDTFEMLRRRKISMEQKAFAVGVRIQHKREWVNRCQYKDFSKDLPTADYKLTYTCEDGRGVYSFCMCPGGYVVNASSEEGRLCINGMSNYDRMAENSNSALVVTLTPEDYRDARHQENPLAGMYYQRKLEEAAYQAGQGRIPTQTYGDFCENRPSKEFGDITPCNKGAVTPGNLRDFLPETMVRDLQEAITDFDRRMPGFANPDALLCAVEARTSSPVRIVRDDTLQSSVEGLYPCGEGAGYAGGITSAAMDGLRVFEAVIRRYLPKQ